MKTIRMEAVVYYEAQDSTTHDEANDVILDLIEMNGLRVASYKSEIISDVPDEE